MPNCLKMEPEAAPQVPFQQSGNTGKLTLGVDTILEAADSSQAYSTQIFSLNARIAIRNFRQNALTDVTARRRWRSLPRAKRKNKKFFP